MQRMKKNEEKNFFTDRKEYLNKNKTLSKENKKKTYLDKILSKYSHKNKTILRHKKNKSENSLKLNKTYNSKNNIIFGRKLSKKKKIEEELFTFSKENRDFFRKALNRYKFDMEVYVPQKLSNKEYSDKNFLINKLIHIENMNKNIKEKIGPIDKETKLFSKQYKLIKSDNKEHQQTYMDNVEKIYQKNGFKGEYIRYDDNENIFTPSFLLDKKFGKDQQKDVFNYSNNNLELNEDENILQKLNIVSSKYMEGEDFDKKDSTKIILNQNWNYKNEKEELLKKEIMEEQKIMNMSKKEYRAYNRKLKNDISLIKKRLKELNQTNTIINNNRNNRNETDLNTNRTNYTGNNIKGFLDLNDKIKENKKVFELYKNDKTNLKKKKDDNNNIFVSARGLDLETDFNKILPSINSLMEIKKEKEEKNINNLYNNKTIPNVKKRRKIKINKENNTKEKKIQNLYSLLNEKIGIYEYPKKEIESYFKKYSERKLPKLNANTGSNIHTIFGDFQNKVKEKSFINLAKGNEYIKIDMNNNYISTNNNSLENKIEKIDEKIKNLHFTVLDKILVNNRKEILNN